MKGQNFILFDCTGLSQLGVGSALEEVRGSRDSEFRGRGQGRTLETDGRSGRKQGQAV